MELIQQKIAVELTPKQLGIIDSMADAAWKAGGIRSPQDGQALEELRAIVRAAAQQKQKEAV